MITRSLCRAARSLLDWTQEDLAQKARISVTALRNFERGVTVPVTNNMLAIEAALQAAGIEFQDGEAPGVRLHPRARGWRHPKGGEPTDGTPKRTRRTMPTEEQGALGLGA